MENIKRKYTRGKKDTRGGVRSSRGRVHNIFMEEDYAPMVSGVQLNVKFSVFHLQV